jgi:hypothetical protein
MRGPLGRRVGSGKRLVASSLGFWIGPASGSTTSWRHNGSQKEILT